MTVGLVVEILGDASKLKSELGDVAGPKGAGGLVSSFGGAALKVAAFAGVAGIAVNVIADMTTAAADDQAEQAKLENAYRQSGAAVGDWSTIMNQGISAAQDKAFTDTQARDALQSLVTTTGSAIEANKLLGPAMDIARFAGVDLATAADAVAKANEGQDGALRKLLPGLEKGATASDTLAAATAAAAGQADTYASSAAGMQESGANAFSELTETIGSVFLPVLEAILPVLIPILKQFATLVQSLLPLIIPLIKALAAELGLFLSIISKVVGWIIQLVNWLTTAATAVGNFLANLNPLKNFKLPSLPFLNSTSAGVGSAGVGRSAGATTTSSGGGSAAPTIVVNTTGDGIEAEQAIVRALRRVGRINGGVIPAYGWAGTTG
jgi:hypothetical protein